MYWAMVSQDHRTFLWSSSRGIASTRESIWARTSWSPSRTGARAKEQFPMTTVVAP
jgi:hypothetical protein